jgi:multicomponent Na+:H+ antiporter subunit G
MLQSDSWQSVVKLAFLVLFLFLTSPTSAHALSKAALHAGVRPRIVGEKEGAP